MATILVDSATVILSGGTCEPSWQWVAMADGSRRNSGEQERDDQGRNRWRVSAILPALGEGDRPDMISVTVASPTEPVVPPIGEPIMFDRLRVRPTVNRRTGSLSMYWDADGAAPRSSRPTSVSAG